MPLLWTWPLNYNNPEVNVLNYKPLSKPPLNKYKPLKPELHNFPMLLQTSKLKLLTLVPNSTKWLPDVVN